jgi:PAS domain S-box-containing protein
MQTRFKRFSVIGGFAILLAILVADAYVTKRQLDQQIETGLWVTHTRQVQLQISDVESLLKDAETGQRGFLYTGDDQYLGPYNQALAKVDSHINALAELTSDNPRQQSAVADLRGLVRTKLDELASTIALYRSGQQDEARKLVLSDAGLVTMDKIRAVIEVMQDEESSLEAMRSAAYRKNILLTTACIYLTTALAVIGLILLAYYILREMSLRERHAQEMRAREEWFRVTLTSIGDGVIATDQNGNVTFLNPIAEELTGITTASASGRNILEIFPIFNETTMAPVDNPVAKVIEHDRPMGLANHTVLRKPDGTLTPIDDSAAPIRDDNGKLIGVVLVFRDISDNRKTERVLRNAEKLGAAARLSATVAHEINNPLEAAVNLVYIARIDQHAPESVVKQLTQAEQELERVAHITRQTLGFFRDNNDPEPIELESLVGSVFRLYSNKFVSKKIRVERHFGKCPPIRGVQNEVKQVLSNLISNAADAVAVGGTIIVTLRCVEEDGRTTVHMLIEDDGPGVADENKERIFEPFFTTKRDVGTGLGLWVSREILERHGGSIELAERENGSRGAAFTVIFEALPEKA